MTLSALQSVTFYRRHLPHLFNADHTVFLTWRLHDSLPPERSFPQATLSSGKAFVAFDRLLEEARTGPMYLSQPPIADMVTEAIHYNATELRHYELHSFVVMPNHVHLLISPRIAVPKSTRSLKGITAKRANQMLGLTGKPFWQEESFDRLVRDETEFEKIRAYIEDNPVRAGLAREGTEFRWSGAGWAAGGPPAECAQHGQNLIG